jgi:hypothetical protein
VSRPGAVFAARNHRSPFTDPCTVTVNCAARVTACAIGRSVCGTMSAVTFSMGEQSQGTPNCADRGSDGRGGGCGERAAEA